MPTSSLNRLAWDSAATLLQQVTATLCAFGSSIVLARLLGPAGQGEYAVVFAVVTLGTMVGNLGIGPATVYHVGSGSVSCGLAWRQNVVLAGLLGLSTSGLLMAGLLCLGGSQWLPNVAASRGPQAATLIPLLLMANLLLSCLQGARRFKAFNVASILPPVVTLATTAIALCLGGAVSAALWCYGTGQLAGVAAALWNLRSEDAGLEKNPWRLNKRYVRSVASYGLLANLGNALSYLNYRIDVFLLNALAGSAAVGLYGIAVGVGERLWLASFAVSVTLMPHVARGGDAPSVTPVIARHILWLACLGALVLAAVAPWALPWIFGPAYADSVAPLWALLPGLAVFSLSRVLSNDIAGRGHPGINAALGVATLALNIGGNLLLIPLWGTVGAAFASTVAYSCDTLGKMWIYRRATATPWRLLLLPQPEDWQRLGGLARRVRRR